MLLKSQRKQKRVSVSFAKDILSENKSTTKDIRSTKILLSQQVHKQTSAPLKHCRSVLYYYESRWGARSLEERSRVNSVVCRHTQGHTKSAQGLTRDQPRSDDVEIQWDIYQSYLCISSLPNQ